MTLKHLPLLALLVTGSAHAFDPVCSSDFETLRLTAEIIEGPTDAEHWRQAQDALLDIQREVVQLLANAHGEWLKSARWKAVNTLQKKLTPIERILLRDRIILYRYAADIATSDDDRKEAMKALRIMQKNYCSLFPEAASNRQLKSTQ